MIESIEFKNFKALRDATLPLGPLTILIGPNGSGKSTVLQALEVISRPSRVTWNLIAHFGILENKQGAVSVKAAFNKHHITCEWTCQWTKGMEAKAGLMNSGGQISQIKDEIQRDLTRIRVFSFDAHKIAEPAIVTGLVDVSNDGSGLAAVFDGMRDEAPEQFKAIENQLSQWMPEFDPVILFDRPKEGCKTLALRTREGQHKVPASDLSQGTLISLALLTLAYHPTPPSLVALEEPDRGLHPYLLRQVKDALVRLAYPESCGENRPPVQVIATTHSPYFVDLFRETPECVVVANKVGLDVKFERLTDQPQLQDILGEAALGDAWFSGVLGGVPSGS